VGHSAPARPPDDAIPGVLKQDSVFRVDPAATLEGRGIRLEPLLREHEVHLRAAAADGELWRLHFTSVPEPENTLAYIESALADCARGTRVPWVVRELNSGRIIGSTSYHDIIPATRRVEIGYTWYAKSWQRTHVNTACKLRLLEHAFDTLGCSVVGWRTDNLNSRSQAAIERLGARKDGVIRRQALRRDGTLRDTVMYSVTEEEWRSGIRDRLMGFLTHGTGRV
jgi:RimJ/RimL family protein N-acetyltransferase